LPIHPAGHLLTVPARTRRDELIALIVLIVLAIAITRLRHVDWHAELEQGPLHDGLQSGASSVADAGTSRAVLTGN